MKKKCTILFLLFVFILKAQNGSVIYEAIIDKDQTANNEMFSPYYQKAKDNLMQIEFELQFNLNESLFFIKENNSIDENKMIRFAKPFIAYTGSTYQDKENCFTLCDDLLDKAYLIKKQIPSKWIITGETKKISGYLCYKATLDETHFYKGKTFPRNTIAWFCPKLPYSYGPNGYGGLPGLILEIQNYKCIYGARKIILSRDNKNLIKKPDGEEITQEKLDEKLFQMFEED